MKNTDSTCPACNGAGGPCLMCDGFGDLKDTHEHRTSTFRSEKSEVEAQVERLRRARPTPQEGEDHE